MVTFLDLAKSPYIFHTSDFKFYFSTKLHKQRFSRELAENRRKVNERLTKRYRIPCKMNLLADLYLYYEIENRGFYVESLKGDVYKWPNLLLTGERLTQIQ